MRVTIVYYVSAALQGDDMVNIFVTQNHLYKKYEEFAVDPKYEDILVHSLG